MAEKTGADVLGLTAQIVAAHIAHNEVAVDALPVLIQSVYRALSAAEVPEAEAAVEQAPAVPVRKSVFSDFIICLEDGRKPKTLKRHLKTSYNMTPAEYRQKWRLPADYPMVAPSYASHRSSLAKKIGLGRKGADVAPEPVVTQVPARRARGSKR